MMLLSLFFDCTAATEIYTYCHTLSLLDALPISGQMGRFHPRRPRYFRDPGVRAAADAGDRNVGGRQTRIRRQALAAKLLQRGGCQELRQNPRLAAVTGVEQVERHAGAPHGDEAKAGPEKGRAGGGERE